MTVLLNEQATLAASARPSSALRRGAAGGRRAAVPRRHGVISDGRYSFCPTTFRRSMPAGCAKAPWPGNPRRSARLAAHVPRRRADRHLPRGRRGRPDAVLRQSRDRAWVGASATTRAASSWPGHDRSRRPSTVSRARRLHGRRPGRAEWARGPQAQGQRGRARRRVELTRYAEVRVPEEAAKIAPTHAQRAVGFFAGSDFFELSAPKSE